MEKIVELANNLPLFVVIFFRVAGIFVSAPLFKDENIPRQIKIGLSILMAYVIFPTVDASAVTLPTTFWSFFIVMVKEVFLGIMIGFVANIVFSAFFVAGDLMGRQMGLRLGGVVDPKLQKQGTSFSSFLYIIATLLFLSLNGHHWFIKAISTSFSAIPIGQMNYSAITVSKITSLFRTFFAAGVTMAAPYIVILMLALTALGLVSRVAPQMNVFFLAFPIKTLLGFGAVLLSLPFLINTMKMLLFSLQREIPTLLATVK